MKILTYHNGGGAPRLGALAVGGEHVIDLTAVAPDAMAGTRANPIIVADRVSRQVCAREARRALGMDPVA